MRWRVVGILAGVMLLAVIGAAVVLRTGAHACTKVGCTTQATFDASSLAPEVGGRATAFVLCLDGRCETTAVGDPNSFGVWTSLVGATVTTGSLDVEDASGSVIARYELAGPVEADLWYPNGEDCEPACPQLRLVAVDGVLRKAAR